MTGNIRYWRSIRITIRAAPQGILVRQFGALTKWSLTTRPTTNHPAFDRSPDLPPQSLQPRHRRLSAHGIHPSRPNHQPWHRSLHRKTVHSKRTTPYR